MHTRICDTFGIDLPIFAFSHCRDVVAAVSRAGGMGVLGALYFTPDELEIELAWIDEHVDGKPYGVDVVMPAKYAGDSGQLDPESAARTLDTIAEFADKARALGVEKIVGAATAALRDASGAADRANHPSPVSRYQTRRRLPRDRQPQA